MVSHPQIRPSESLTSPRQPWLQTAQLTARPSMEVGKLVKQQHLLWERIWVGWRNRVPALFVSFRPKRAHQEQEAAYLGKGVEEQTVPCPTGCQLCPGSSIPALTMFGPKVEDGCASIFSCGHIFQHGRVVPSFTRIMGTRFERRMFVLLPCCCSVGNVGMNPRFGPLKESHKVRWAMWE